MEGDSAGRWVFAGIMLALVIALVVWARGPVHHRGAEIGVHAGAPTAVRVSR